MRMMKCLGQIKHIQKYFLFEVFAAMEYRGDVKGS